MTENPPADILAPRDPYVGPAVTARPDAGLGDDARPGTVDVAKDQAASVGQSAAGAGQHVAGVAQEQAKNVVAEAGSQAKDLLGQARGELTDQASTQQQRLAAGLHALGDELHSMAHNSQQSGVATDLARQGASKSHDIAAWLEDREPGNLVQEVQKFARQRPAAFLLIAAGAGLLAGRLTRGAKDASSDDSHSDSQFSGAASSAPGSVMTAPIPVMVEPAALEPNSSWQSTGPAPSGGAGR